MTCMDKAPDTLDYKEWCFKTWQYWCNKHNVELIVLDQELRDKTIMKPTWQRWHVFDILDNNGNAVSGFTGLTTCRVTKGVYKVAVNSFIPTTIPCLFYDLWKGLYINGVSIPNVENEFAVLERGGNYTIGTTTQTPKLYGFSFDGIKQNEKVLNTDIRKVNLTIKKAYSSNQVLNNIEAYYRIYVREGANTEVQVQDWTRINKTTDSYYFMFDTTDKIPNEYFVDMKVISDRNTDTYKRALQFQIVNKK